MVETFVSAPFNMALAYLQRLDNLLNLVNESSINGEVGTWLNALEAVYMEVIPMMKKEDLKKIKPMVDDVKKLFNIWTVTIRNTKIKNHVFEGSKLETKLNEMNIALRVAINNAGLLMPKGNDPRFALSRGYNQG